MRLSLLVLPLIATAAIATASYSDDRGPGIAGVRQGDAVTFPASGFDAVGFELPGDADVRVGPSWSVRATGPAAGFANVRVAIRDGRLEIGHRRDDSDSNAAERQLRFTITLPRLSSVALGGSGRMAVDQVRGEALKAAVGGSGTLTLGRIDVRSATVSIGGSGSVRAQGTAGQLAANLGGSGSLDAPGLRATGARVSIAGSGSIRAAVDGSAQVSAVGSGQVDLGPRARCSVTRMGHATVRCG